MHYYQFNIGDYASHTRHLTIIEDIAYRRLLDLYYLHEQPLDERSTVVARLINMRENEAEVAAVLLEFFQLHEGVGWINSRADAEIAKFHSKQEQASRAGKASAERRSNARSTDVQPTNNQEPITNISPTDVVDKPTAIEDKPKREKKRASQLPPDFYPNETGVRYAEERGVNLAVELTSFGNWHKSKGTTLKDWQAGWRTWCDKAVEFGRAGRNRTNGGNQRATAFDQRCDTIAALTGYDARQQQPRQQSELDISGSSVRLD